MTDPQVIVNLGTGGSDLNGQNGSTSSADSNDARFLDWPGDNAGNYVYLPGVAGNRLSVPDSAELSITGDIDIRMYMALDSWTLASNQYPLGKWTNGYILGINSSAKPFLQWTETGPTSKVIVATEALTFADETAHWLRVTLDVDNGASGNDVKFYTSSDGVSWVQFGSTVTTAGVTDIVDGSNPLVVGGFDNTNGSTALRIYRAQILDGIDGTTVLDVDTSVITSGSATSFTALTGQTVTINRSTSGRKSVAVVSPVHLFGTDDYWEVADNALLDFDDDQAFTLVSVIRPWTTMAANRRVIDKIDSAALNGYGLFLTTTPSVSGVLNGGSYLATPTSPSFSAGSLVVAAVSLTSADVATSYANGSAGTPSSVARPSLSNAFTLRIGTNRTNVANLNLDGELLAVAIFRRALTSNEISALTTYYENRLS